MLNPHRGLILAGGIAGALGVALSAAAAHHRGANLATAASFLLMHAPALLALSVIEPNRTARVGGLALVVGLALFCGDLLSLQFLESRLFPYAAPGGGLLLIGGWLAIAASALIPRQAA